MIISEMKAAVRSGLVRQHKWRVLIDFPTYAGNNADSKQASMLARTAATPPSTMGVIDLAWGGRVLPLPGDRQYQEFEVTFIAVNDQNVYNAFQRWSEAVNGSSTNTGLVNIDDFMQDITFQLLDQNDTVTQTWVLKDAWVPTVGSMQMDSGALDTYSEFSVVFRYINYEIPGITN